MPFGTLALEGTAMYRPEPIWDGQLYRAVAPVKMQSVPIRMIPYYAWNNRGAAAMSVWLPVVFGTD
jgi:DUF1680 family protein